MEPEDIEDLRYSRHQLRLANVRIEKLYHSKLLTTTNLNIILIDQVRALCGIHLEVIEDPSYAYLIDVINRAFFQSQSWLTSTYACVDDYLNMHHSINWAIIELDYDSMYDSAEWLRRELSEYLYHPRLIQKWIDAGNCIDRYRDW